MSNLDNLRVWAWREDAWEQLFLGNMLLEELKSVRGDSLDQVIPLIEECQQTLSSSHKLSPQNWSTAWVILVCAQLAYPDRVEARRLPDSINQLAPCGARLDPRVYLPASRDAVSWSLFLKARIHEMSWKEPINAEWVWDILLYFRQADRKVIAKENMTLLLLNEKDEGITADLTLELLEDGKGVIYPAPRHMAFVGCSGSFQHAVKEAKDYLRLRNDWPEGNDVRWNIARQDGKPLTYLDGESAGGAFSIGLSCLFAEA